jgi:two-component system CheB/CheR fusion protein
VVDPEGTLVLANGHARSLFALAPRDIGRPLKDLELSYRPVDLRSHLEIAFSERRTVSLGPVTTTPPAGEERTFEVQITPLRLGDRVLGASILYQDVTRQRRIDEELETSKHELENATGSCSRPSRSSRRRTRSSSRRTKSSRRRTRSCNRPTRSSRR